MKRTVVIMAGGSGERFWPLSRINKPKQLLALVSDKTMLEEAIDRVKLYINNEDIFIITSKVLLEPIRKVLPQLPPENIVAEPYKRNTAPCLALASAFISSRYEGSYSPSEISIAVLTADHIIEPKEAFLKTIETAFDFVEKNKALATIGIPPTKPHTGFGYIEVESPFDNNQTNCEIKPVLRFLEKPNYEKAVEFLEKGNYLWNSGMFFWRLDTFNSSLCETMPEIGNKIETMKALYANNTEKAFEGSYEAIDELFKQMPDISIDYALMEKAKNVVVAKALFQWDDVGSLDSLQDKLPKDESNNITKGTCIICNTSDSIIINSTTQKKMLFAGLGLNNMVVVLTDDAVLVCPKDKVQDIKNCISEIRKRGYNEYL